MAALPKQTALFVTGMLDTLATVAVASGVLVVVFRWLRLFVRDVNRGS